MKCAAAILAALSGSLLAAATQPAPPPAGPPPDAAARLGIAFSPPLVSAITPSGSLPPATRLPKFDVHAPRIDLEPQELLTPKGRLAFAKDHELSPLYRKTFGPLSLLAAAYFNPLLLLSGAKPNDAEAIVLYEQDERLRRKHEAEGLIEVYKLEDPVEFERMKASLRDTFQLDPPIGLHLP